MAAPFDPICLFEILDHHEVNYVLIGGLAGVLHGSSATTSDADIVPATDTANLERLSRALGDLGARIRSPSEPDGISFDPHPELLGSVTILNLTTRCGDLDLTLTPSGLGGYDEIAPGAGVFDVDGLSVMVASLDDIIRSKEAADRPRDRATLPILHALRDEIDRNRRE